MTENLTVNSRKWITSALAMLLVANISTVLYIISRPHPRSSTGRREAPVKTDARSYSFMNDDYPTEWPIYPLEKVHMSLEDTNHYEFNTPRGRSEWNSTLPAGGAIVHLGPSRRPFTVGMFHEIRCLGIIREILDEFYSDHNPGASFSRPHLARHCMNYLRQMILCRANMRLETVRAEDGIGITVHETTHTCKDWSALYRAAEENYKDFT